MRTGSSLTKSKLLQRGCGLLGKTTQFEWEEDHLVEETIMCGVQGKKAFIFIKGGRGSHRGLCFEYLISCLLGLFGVFCCLAELQCCLVLGPHYVSFLLYILMPPYLYNHLKKGFHHHFHSLYPKVYKILYFIIYLICLHIIPYYSYIS